MSNNCNLTGAELIANMANELSKARNIINEMVTSDDIVVNNISDLEVLVSDIDADMDRYNDYVESIDACTEGIKIE